MTRSLILTIALVAISINPAHQTNPGLQLQISQAGFNYVAQVAIDQITADIKGKHIDDQSGSARVTIGKVDYSLTGMTVTEFGRPQSAVTVTPGSSLTWSLSAVSATIHGDWRYKYRKAFIKISDHGSFDVSVSGASLSVSVTMGVDGNGRPTIRTTACSSNGGSVKVKFHRGASWLYNLFSHEVEKPLKKKIQEMLCTASEKAINEMGEAQLAKMKVQTAIKNLGTLDYRLVAAPVFGSQFVATHHKGEFFWTGNTTEAPFPPLPMPAPPVASRMISIGLSQYVMDTLGYVTHTHGLLKKHLTAKDLPPDAAGVLNVTCTSGLCIGSVLPQLKKLYPHGVLEMAMASTAYPRLVITPKTIQGVFVAQIGFSVRLPSGELKFVFRADVGANMTLTAAMQGTRITASVSNWTTTVEVKDSQIGPVSGWTLDLVLNEAFNRFIKPQLDALGKKGLDVPSIDDIDYVNPSLTLMAGALYLETNVKYTPQTTLFFQG
nr:lipopolysaccharide-binding protein 4 [Arenicola marina]